MQTIESVFATDNFRAEEAPEFKMVIAYDDFANGRWAMKFLDWIVAEFGKLFIFVPTFLKFEELFWPEVGRRVARTVAEADVVVIAAYEDSDLPSLVKDWLRTWGRARRRNETTLVALLSASQDSTALQAPVRSHLQQVARRTGMKFLCDIDWPKQDFQFPVEIDQRTAQGRSQGIAAGHTFPHTSAKNSSNLGRQGINGTIRWEAVARSGKAFGGGIPVPYELIRDNESSATGGLAAVADATFWPCGAVKAACRQPNQAKT
jgi:hypothetical protein